MPPVTIGSGRSLLSERANIARRTSPASMSKRTGNLRMRHPLSAEDRRRAVRTIAGSVRRGGSESRHSHRLPWHADAEGVMPTPTPPPTPAFASLSLDPRLLAALAALGYEEPTPIQ